ncbi:hypothetical protein A2U01_0093908, partial [Trifolium medium]|nr:hypothetical protein [Trifolium medium]
LPSSPGLPNKWYQSRGSAWWGAGVNPPIGSTIGWVRCDVSLFEILEH